MRIYLETPTEDPEWLWPAAKAQMELWQAAETAAAVRYLEEAHMGQELEGKTCECG